MLETQTRDSTALQIQSKRLGGAYYFRGTSALVGAWRRVRSVLIGKSQIDTSSSIRGSIENVFNLQ